MNIHHTPSNWKEELKWVIQTSQGKSCKAKVLKYAFVEKIYECRMYTNEKIYDNKNRYTNIGKNIMDIVVYKLWTKPKLH